MGDWQTMFRLGRDRVEFERCCLTRRRGGAEKHAENIFSGLASELARLRRKVKTWESGERRSYGFAARLTLGWKADQRSARRIPQRGLVHGGRFPQIRGEESVREGDDPGGAHWPFPIHYNEGQNVSSHFAVPIGRPFARRRRRSAKVRLRQTYPGSLCRSEEHTSELQSLTNLVCRLLLEKKKTTQPTTVHTPRTHEHG